MIQLLALSALVAVALAVPSDVSTVELPAARYNPDKEEWEFYSLRRGRSNKVFAVQRSASSISNTTSSDRQGITIPVPDWVQTLIKNVQDALTPPVAVSTPITDLIEATVELSPTDLTLLICDQADPDSCGQVTNPGAGSCSGILGVNICMCSLPNFVLSMRTGKCKPMGPNGLVCAAATTCTIGQTCNNLEGSLCSAPTDTTRKCTCPAGTQFDPANCNCVATSSTECAKTRNLCNQIDLFAFCQTRAVAVDGLQHTCLCSFGFTKRRGSCVKDLGTLVALKKPKLYLAGKVTGLVGVVLGAIFIVLSLKKASACDVLAEVRAYDEYKETVNDSFDRMVRSFTCDPDEFDVEDNELAAY